MVVLAYMLRNDCYVMKNRSSSLSDNISDIKSSGKMQLNNGSALSPVFDADADPTRYLPICCCIKGSTDRNRLAPVQKKWKTSDKIKYR